MLIYKGTIAHNLLNILSIVLTNKMFSEEQMLLIFDRIFKSGYWRLLSIIFWLRLIKIEYLDF